MPTNKFHYIWMGRFPAGKYEGPFKSGPNNLAKQLKEYVMDINERKIGSPNPQDQEIIMWIPEDLIEKIQSSKYLDPDITLKPIEHFYENAQHLTPEEKKDLIQTVDILGQYNAYSAQKDLLQAAILEEYGGYYFDTTTTIESIKPLIDSPPKAIWFPRLSEDGGEKNFEGDYILLPDVWAMYVPNPGEGTCKAMLNSYIQRCQFYFPHEYKCDQLDLDKLKDERGRIKSGYKIASEHHDTDETDQDIELSYAKGSEIMVGTLTSKRDDLIGELVIFSLCDGLKQTKGKLTDSLMKRYSSFAKDQEDGGKYVKELGITKTHKGMWRIEAIADSVEARAEARAEARENAPIKTRENAPGDVQETSERIHAFTLGGADFENFKIKYQTLKGDKLKSQIISNFEQKLSEITDKETLEHFVSDFKKSADYGVLSTRQGLTSWILSLETDSMRKVERLIEAKENELGSTSSPQKK